MGNHTVKSKGRGRGCQGIFFKKKSTLTLTPSAAALEVEKWKTLGRMVAGFVHQFRSPLQTIQTTTELLRGQKGLLPEQRQPLDLIERSAGKLSRIVSHLLLYAKGEQPPMNCGSINPVVNAAADYAEELCKRKGLHFEKHQEAKLPDVFFQAELLEQAVLNYAVNAIEAMTPGGTLTLSTQVTNKGSVQILIRDTGPGLKLPKPGKTLFKTTKPGGVGLGLFFAARIIEQHHAQTQFQSIPKIGTTVTLTFPSLSDAEISNPS